jgi:hypothetical protein
VINANVDYKLGVSIKGSTVSVTLGGQAVLGKVFNAVAVDGDFGLLAVGAPADFDGVTVKTNDAAFAPAAGASMLAADGASAGSGDTLTQSQLDGASSLAIGDWIDTLGGGDPRLASLGDMRISFADLAGDTLGYTSGRNVLIDSDAAGYGWSLGGSGSADGRMDLGSVVSHEIGHVLGLDHDEAPFYAVMDEDLEQGVRYTLSPAQEANASRSAPATVPTFDLGAMAGVGAIGAIDWKLPDSYWGVLYSPFTATPATTGSAIFPEFLVKLAPRGGVEAPQFDSLGSALLGKRGKAGR